MSYITTAIAVATLPEIRFAVVGGLAIRAQHVAHVEARIRDLKNSIEMQSEFKWSAFRGGRKTAIYEALIDLFFELIDDNTAHFHSMICDFEAFDHHLNGRGSPHSSVNRLYYQLMLHRICRNYGSNWRILMFPDHGIDSDQIGNFRGAICAAAYRQYQTQPNCLRSIEPTDSRKNGVLQMVDVVIGALAAQRENRQLNAVKTALRNYVIERCPVPDLEAGTDRDERRFSVWAFRTNS